MLWLCWISKTLIAKAKSLHAGPASLKTVMTLTLEFAGNARPFDVHPKFVHAKFPMNLKCWRSARQFVWFAVNRT